MGYLTQSSLNLWVQIYSESFSGLKLPKRTGEEGIHHRLSSSVLYLAWGRWGPHLVGVQQRVLGGGAVEGRPPGLQGACGGRCWSSSRSWRGGGHG